MMRVSVTLTVAGLVVAALVLAACSETTLPQCPKQANTTPGTISAGQVSIATDHSIYAPGDTIRATITNHLSTGIVINNYMYTDRCPYFALQMRAGNDWQDMHACPPMNGDTQPGNHQRLIAAGAAFSSGVGIHADLPAGTYRLWISSYSIGDAQGRAAGVGPTES
ncbi:MAG: hypothetical protein ACXVCO_18680, partial [Ktedonobacterales bacterium]